MAEHIALYRKYRSRDWSEVVGQEHIVTTLQKSVASGRIAHAYLFTGPKGVGKTSVARILARAVNGLNFDDGVNHLDVIEIDAASNRRIDEIRDLRDKIHVAPTSAKFKVYIIDEVHMLTKEAFNALLKTLEEPPAHAVFILATTEAHKLPATIVSRTQRHAFRALTPQQMVGHLKHIAKAEKIKVDDEALELIAEHGDGSFRDSISLLDQLASAGDDVTGEAVRSLIGLPPQQAVDQLLMAVRAHDTAASVRALNSLREQGFTAAILAQQLYKVLREQSMRGGLNARDIDFMDELLRVSGSPNPEAQLELVVLGQALRGQPARAVPEEARPEPPQIEEEPIVVEIAKKEPTKAKATPKPKRSGDTIDEAAWQQILKKVKQKNNALYAVLRMADPRQQGKNLVLAFAFPFHVQRAQEGKNLETICEAIAEELGDDFEVKCELDEAIGRPEVSREASVKLEEIQTPTQRVTDLFGGGEVVDL